MEALGIRAAALRSGLTEPTHRYYEVVGLIGPIARDPGTGATALRRYGATVNTISTP
jgi:DNA-binding transcriptional MerR regulator